MRNADPVQIHQGTLHSAYKVTYLTFRENATSTAPLRVLLPQRKRYVFILQLNVHKVAVHRDAIRVQLDYDGYIGTDIRRL